ncbi:MAG: Gfo/Idh/MocA family oxidoreductase [Rhizobiales bacterium]|nr:Gfo/Idh/MocA family oxidoreductase [Hyphomicrobiales bacterium]
MSRWPQVDFGHTAHATAFGAADVYGVRPDPQRAGKKPLKLAIAGAGGVAQAKWIPAIRRLQTMGEPADIVGVADPDAAACRKSAGLCGCEGYESVEAMLDAQRPDLLLVLTADAAHAPAALAAIERGVAVLVEKPLARDPVQAEALVQAAAARGVLLAAVANKRFSPPYAMAKALVVGGALRGTPRIFTGKFTLGYPYVDLLEGGTVHLIDLMLWFMGPVAQLQARSIGGPDGGLESAVVSVRFASGAIGTLMTSRNALSFKPWERVEIFGAGAFLVVDDQLTTTLYDEETGPAKSWSPAIPNTLLFDEAFGGYAGLLENVLDALRGLVPLAATGADGADAVRIIAAIHQAAATGADIEIRSQGLDR